MSEPSNLNGMRPDRDTSVSAEKTAVLPRPRRFSPDAGAHSAGASVAARQDSKNDRPSEVVLSKPEYPDGQEGLTTVNDKSPVVSDTEFDSGRISDDVFAEIAPAKPVSLPKPKRRNPTLWIISGLALGVLLSILALSIYNSANLKVLANGFIEALLPGMIESLSAPPKMATKTTADQPTFPPVAGVPPNNAEPNTAASSTRIQPIMPESAAPAVATPAQSLPASNSGVSPLAKSLFDIGALSCIARANQIANIVGNGTEAIVLQKPFGNPDKSLVTATMMPSTPDKSQSVSIVTLAPNQANGCDGNYQSIRVIDKPCAAAISEKYGPDRTAKIGNTGIQVVALSQSSRILAVPLASQCLVIVQESKQ